MEDQTVGCYRITLDSATGVLRLHARCFAMDRRMLTRRVSIRPAEIHCVNTEFPRLTARSLLVVFAKLLAHLAVVTVALLASVL